MKLPEWYKETSQKALEQRKEEALPEVKKMATIFYNEWMLYKWLIVGSILINGGLYFDITHSPILGIIITLLYFPAQLYIRKKMLSDYQKDLKKYTPEIILHLATIGLEFLPRFRAFSLLVVFSTILSLLFMINGANKIDLHHNLIFLISLWSLIYCINSGEKASLYGLLLSTQKPRKKQKAENKIKIKNLQFS